MRFQPGFPGMFSPWRWLGGQEHGLKCLRDTHFTRLTQVRDCQVE